MQHMQRQALLSSPQNTYLRDRLNRQVGELLSEVVFRLEPVPNRLGKVTQAIAGRTLHTDGEREGL